MLFKEEGTSLVTIAPIHILYWNIIVNEDSPIKTIWGLEDKRVNLQPKGSSAESTATKLFEALDINIIPSYYRHTEAGNDEYVSNEFIGRGSTNLDGIFSKEPSSSD